MFRRRKYDPEKVAAREDRRKRKVAAVSLLLGIAGLASQQFVIGAVFAVPAALYLRRRAIEGRHQKAVTTALKDVDVVIRGRQICGRTSEVVGTRQVETESKASDVRRFEQLCRTVHGSWFLLTFSTTGKSCRPLSPEVILFSEGQAAAWCGRDPALYRRTAGATARSRNVR